MSVEISSRATSGGLERIAQAAIESIPDELRQHIRDVVIRIDDFPGDAVMAEMNLSSPYDLLGLYQGISLDRKSVSDPMPDVDMIFLYREPIMVYAEQTGEALERVVRHVLIHEIGHHFGLSDDDMRRIEKQD
ncbi:MAG: metallopeptidase family protein [Rhodospirillales bacterium]|jgi:predicted Zn-dependent protease with MMP-like domain